jgi:hypothetical protein
VPFPAKKFQVEGGIRDQKQIPFDFAQGRLSGLAGLARRNDNMMEINMMGIGCDRGWRSISASCEGMP